LLQVFAEFVNADYQNLQKLQFEEFILAFWGQIHIN